MIDPKALPRYSVIHIYYEFEGQNGERKFFVVLCHEKVHVVCLKATSNTAKYQNDPKQLAGCVFYKAGALPIFHSDTVIQPQNVVPISYDHIVKEDKNGRCENKGILPSDFHGKLVAAVKASIVISPKRKKFLLGLIDEVL